MSLEDWLTEIGMLLGQRAMVTQVMNLLVKAPATSARDGAIASCEIARKYLTDQLVYQLQRAEFDFGLIPPKNP